MEWTNQPLYRIPPPIADRRPGFQLPTTAVSRKDRYSPWICGAPNRRWAAAARRSHARSYCWGQEFVSVRRGLSGTRRFPPYHSGETLFPQGRHARQAGCGSAGAAVATRVESCRLAASRRHDVRFDPSVGRRAAAAVPGNGLSVIPIGGAHRQHAGIGTLPIDPNALRGFGEVPSPGPSK